MFILSKDICFEVKMLWASVLRRAIFDYVLYRGVRSRSLDWKRAYQYVFTEGAEYENGFSFEEVCAMFDWDPEYLRRLTTKLTRRDVKKMETSYLRGDFTFNEVEAAVSSISEWKISHSAVPFLPSFKFAVGYESLGKQKVVWRETLLKDIPIESWGVAA